MTFESVCTRCGATCHMDVADSVIGKWVSRFEADPQATLRELARRERDVGRLQRKLLDAGGLDR